MRARTRVATLLIGLGVCGPLIPIRAARSRRPDPDPAEDRAEPARRQQRHDPVERPDAALQHLLQSRLTPQKFQIEGVKTIPFAEIAAKFAPLAGHEITVAQLLEAANEVTQMYQQRGYPLSFAFVPAQTFENGNVTVTVVEGYVKTITIRGKAGAAEDRLRAIGERLMQDKPLRRETFEHYANVLGLQPGMQVAATVQPPQTTDGACELVLDIKRKPVTFGTGIEYMSPGLRAISRSPPTACRRWVNRSRCQPCFPRARTRKSTTRPTTRSRSAPRAWWRA